MKTAHEKRDQRNPSRSLVFCQQQRRNQKARDHEKQIDPEKAAVCDTGQIQVVHHHHQNRQRAQSVQTKPTALKGLDLYTAVHGEHCYD